MTSIDIKLGGYQPPTSVHNRAAEIFGLELNARVGDAVAFEMNGNMVESDGIQAIDLPKMVDRGDLDMCYFASSYLADDVPEVAIFDLPFLVHSREKAYAALDGELGELLAKKFQENTGLRILAYWDNGFRHFTNGVRPLREPTDCQGLKIRTMNSEMHQQSFKLLGFEPTFVDVRDLVEAAKSGRIDAQENPLTNTYKFGTYHYHRYITLSGHFFGMVMLMVHEKTFQSWPEDVQKAVQEAADIATKAQRGFAVAEDDDVLAALDPAENEIIELSDEERADFEKAVEPLLQEQREKLGDQLFEMVG